MVAAVVVSVITVASIALCCPRFLRIPSAIAAIGALATTALTGLAFPWQALVVSGASLLITIARLVVDHANSARRTARDSGLLAVQLFTTLGLWLLVGAPFRLLVMTVALLVAASCAFSLLVAHHRRPACESPDPMTDASPETLVARDIRLLEALYRAAHGEAGKVVSAEQIMDLVDLPVEQIIIACERLLARRKLDEINGFYALRHDGVKAVEDSTKRSDGRVHVSTGDSFTFNAPASGVFGRESTVANSTFGSSTVVPPELLANVTQQAADLRRVVPVEQQREIDDAVEAITAAGDDTDKVSKHAGRLAAIAKAAGEIGVPVITAVSELVKAIGGG